MEMGEQLAFLSPVSPHFSSECVSSAPKTCISEVDPEVATGPTTFGKGNTPSVHFSL